MGEPVTHTWITRVHCSECDQCSWTNPGSASVVCRCGTSAIHDDVLVTGEVVTDEEMFKQAVADDLGSAVEDLTLVQG